MTGQPRQFTQMFDLYGMRACPRRNDLAHRKYATAALATGTGSSADCAQTRAALVEGVVHGPVGDHGALTDDHER